MYRHDALAWLEKCEKDIDAVKRALIPMPDQNLEIAAYHCQQAAEKAIKALLVHLDIDYPRKGGSGHNIGVIASKIPSDYALYDDAFALAPLTPWATAFRYPVDDPSTSLPLPDSSEVEEYLEKISMFVDDIRREIGTPDNTSSLSPDI